MDDIFQYWFDNFRTGQTCVLCGNSGIVDTRQTAKNVENNNPCGQKTYCFCANGQNLRKGRACICAEERISTCKATHPAI
jgi:hypothetical protein